MTKLRLWLAGILIALASYLIGNIAPVPVEQFGAYEPSTFVKMKTSSNITVAETSTLIQATTSRQYMVIVNDGAYPVYLALDGDAAAVASKGIRLNATGGAYEIIKGDGNGYNGAIRAIAVGGSSVVTISSY